MNIHFKTAADYIKRSPFQALAAVFVLSLTFFVATLVSILVYSSTRLLTYFETRPQVIAFLKSDAGPEAISGLQNKLVDDSRIREVKYVSKEEALSIYKKATSDNPLLGELVSPTIFPASLEFSLKDLSYAQDIIAEIKKEKIVESVGFTASLGGEENLQDVVGRLRTLTNYVRIGGGIFTGMLLLASFAILLIIISMRMAQRREEAEILNLIGATSKFIRSPIILEALIYSIAGVLLGWITSFIAILFLAPALLGYFGDIPVLPRESLGLIIIFAVVLGAELVFGIALSLMGSLLAISRVRRAR